MNLMKLLEYTMRITRSNQNKKKPINYDGFFINLIFKSPVPFMTLW